MTYFDPWLAIRQHEGRVQATRENTARIASAYAFFDSHGWGEFAFPVMFDFGLTFIEQPCVGYAYALDGDQLVDLRFPRSHGGVYRWRKDVRGYYTGAWCFVVVETRSPHNIANVPALDPGYDLDHSFTFTGIALKDLPSDLLDH